MAESVDTVKFSCICMAMNVTRTRNEFNRTCFVYFQAG